MDKHANNNAQSYTIQIKNCNFFVMRKLKLKLFLKFLRKKFFLTYGRARAFFAVVLSISVSKLRISAFLGADGGTFGAR